MLTESLITIAGVHLISVASPGPDFAVVTRSSIRSGLSSGIATALGIVTANLIYVAAVLGGLSLVVQQSPVLLPVIKYLGASFLLYLSYKCIQSNGLSDLTIAPSTVESPATSYVRGLTTSLLNPKAILYFTCILSQFIQPGTPLSHRTLFGAVVVAISGFWFLSVAHLISWSKFRVFFCRASKWIDRGMAVVFVGFALAMVFG